MKNTRFDIAAMGLSGKLREVLLSIPLYVKESAQEIRLRVNRPLTVYSAKKVYFISKTGRVSEALSGDLWEVSQNDVSDAFHNICEYAVYSHQQEIKNGYLTMKGGFRVGLCGTAVFHEGEMSGIREISGLNIRIARELHGCAGELIERLGGVSGGLLLAGPPSCGKTTLLRDLARQLSLGLCGPIQKVAVIDERSELAGTYLGVSQNDLGLCDILDGYHKGEGILQAVRCLSPDVIICDEVGKLCEIEAIEEGLNAGVSMIASVHAGSLQELLQRAQVRRLLSTGAFETLALLCSRGSPGKIAGIYKVGELDVKSGGLDSDYSGGRGTGILPVA